MVDNYDELPDEEVVGESKPEDDLDNWFEDEPEVDQSADEEEETEEEASTPDDSSEKSPDTKVQEAAAEQAVGDGNSTQPVVQDDPYAWRHDLAPELRAQVESLVHRDQSQRGRVAALQSRLDRLAAEQEARARTTTKPAANKAVGEGKNVEEMDDDELAEFMEQFPSVYRNMEKLLDKRIEREVRPLQENLTAARIAGQKEHLRYNAAHIFNTAETGVELEDVLNSPRFKEWIVTQPPGYQKFARTAESVEDATKVLVDFAQYTDAEVYRLWMENNPDQAAAQQAPQEDHQTADQIAARRQAALKGTGVKSRSAELSRIGASDDYDAYFDEAVNQGRS